MKKIIYLTFLFAFCLNLTNTFGQNVRCKLEGKVIGRSSPSLLLLKVTEDFRFEGIKIPIVKNAFSYELKVPFVEKYELIFEDEIEAGAFKQIEFFAENGTLNFELHSTDDFDKNTVTGSTLTQKMMDFTRQKFFKIRTQNKPIRVTLDSLERTDNLYSEKAKQLQLKYRSATNYDEGLRYELALGELRESGEMWTPLALAQMNRRDSMRRQRLKWEYEYIRQNPDVFSYSLLLDLIKSYSEDKKNVDISVLSELFPTFSKLYPSHPYTTKIAELLNAIHNLKVGDHFLDFSAPTVDGEVKKVSELIKGKVAVIDMWASWCGPCRYLSKSMIPVYEKYKDKGFTIVGVAAEFKSKEPFKAAVKKDKYPWINLIELDKQNGIWNKYNISASAGNTYLVDSKGVILAIHPKAEELDKILGDILK